MATTYGEKLLTCLINEHIEKPRAENRMVLFNKKVQEAKQKNIVSIKDYWYLPKFKSTVEKLWHNSSLNCEFKEIFPA